MSAGLQHRPLSVLEPPFNYKSNHNLEQLFFDTERFRVALEKLSSFSSQPNFGILKTANSVPGQRS